MKNFTLFLTFLACSTVAMASEVEAPVNKNQVTRMLVSLQNMVEGICALPGKAVNSLDSYAAVADAKITEGVSAVTSPAVTFAKSTCNKTVELAQTAYDATITTASPYATKISSFVQRPTVIITAVVIAAAYYVYNQDNNNPVDKKDNNSK